MGFGGISIWQLLIILAIVVLLFGTKRLKGMGADIGGAVKGFKKALNSDVEDKNDASADKTDSDSKANNASAKKETADSDQEKK